MDLLERVAATRLVAPGMPVVVLLSGGRDSVCLLDLACEIAGAGAVRALHVNYGLRSDASAGDEAHCHALSQRLGVALEVHRASEPEGNLQAWARDLRYAVGAQMAAATGARLAAGHTLTDQVETILYRLASSPGRRALLGMNAASGLLIRPLLAARITREETAEWCRSRDLQWREDAFNADPRFARSRVRDGLVFALKEVDERAEANVLRTAELLREEAEVLDEVVASALAGRDCIAHGRLAALPRALGRLVLRRLAEDATRRLCPRAAGRLDDVLALNDGALDLGDGARVVIKRGIVRVDRTPDRTPGR